MERCCYSSDIKAALDGQPLNIIHIEDEQTVNSHNEGERPCSVFFNTWRD